MSHKLEYDVQKEFELSRDMLKYFVGLDLCLSEQVILRKIVFDANAGLSRITLPRNRYQPATEGAVRFLMQEYGITLVDKEFYEPILGGYYSENASRALQFVQEQRLLL